MRSSYSPLPKACFRQNEHLEPTYPQKDCHLDRAFRDIKGCRIIPSLITCRRLLTILKMKYWILLITFLTQATVATGMEPDVIFQKDVEQLASRLENYPIKLCIGDLGYAAMAAKTDAFHCRNRSDISYDDCMKIGKENRDFSHLIINKRFKAITGDVIYLKKNLKYSFYTGSGGIVMNFAKERNSTFSFHTANYGGVTLDPVKKCP
jgi:hypothetical protein